jgi:hypothetical protein
MDVEGLVEHQELCLAVCSRACPPPRPVLLNSLVHLFLERVVEYNYHQSCL